MNTYFADFNAGRDAEEIAARYWSSQVTLYTPDSMEHLSSSAEVQEWLAGVQTGLARQGWVRTDVVEARICRSAEKTMLYSVRFNRVLGGGESSLGAATYILVFQGGWRIAGLIFARPENLAGCA